jgi:hypothetical protein
LQGPARPLRITPARRGSGQHNVSEAHDRYLAERGSDPYWPIRDRFMPPLILMINITSERRGSNSSLERMLATAADCIIYYNACILSELLEHAERRQVTNGPTRSSEQTRQAGRIRPLLGLQLPGYPAMGSTFRNWSISWRRPGAGATGRRTDLLGERGASLSRVQNEKRVT